ncbi:MAG: PAS domain-containing sensor histidine kinase [Verrucomicrobia bacterium]|nr:PAS domain-containing sensor histidine kinase [Prolixibacteraceae bacterium]
MGKDKYLFESALLRHKAVEQYNKQKSLKTADVSDVDLNELLQELEVYKIQLEMQNEILHQAIEKAEAASEKYSLISDFIPAGHFTLDRDGKILDLNLLGASILGNDREALINNDFRFFLTRHTRPEFDELLHDIFDLNMKSSREVRLSLSGEPSGFIHLVGMLSEDEAKCFIMTVDITDYKIITESLKDSEIRYRRLFESAKDGILILDAVSGKIMDANPYLVQLLGYSYEDLLGKEIWEIEAFKNIGYSMDNFIELQIKGEIRYGDMPLETKKGKSISVEFVSNVYVANHVKVIQCHIRDITERKRVEKALRDSETRLIELNSTKDKFFSIIAHDLKGPFNSILGFSELLTDRIKDNDYEEIEKYAMIIHNSARRAMDLIMNLLEWSRSQTGRMEFNPENMDLVSLIRTISQLLNDIALQKLITLYTETPEHVMVFADKAMMGTVMRNLISNAIKFTNPEGEIVISIDHKMNKLIVTVADNGVGIKPEGIEKLFVIEKSYSTVGTQGEKGTGLGLILCKEFIERHGGEIWVESEFGKGSKFHFTIPENFKNKHNKFEVSKKK